jgi:hypothetical protein
MPTFGARESIPLWKQRHEEDNHKAGEKLFTPLQGSMGALFRACYEYRQNPMWIPISK